MEIDNNKLIAYIAEHYGINQEGCKQGVIYKQVISNDAFPKNAI